MRVAILRNNFEKVNVSMKNYADTVVEGLRSESEFRDICEVSPESGMLGSILPDSRFFGRFKNYVERFCLYPGLIKSTRADIYHIIDHTFAHLLKYLKGRKSIVTCHDLIVLKLARGDFKGQKAPGFASFLFKKSIEHIGEATRIISVSENTKNDLIEMLGVSADRISTVHNGINPIFFNQVTGPKVLKDTFTILHVGGDWFYKNIEAIIEAIALLKGSLRKRLKFLRVGAPLNAFQKDLANKRHVSENITALPSVSLDQLPGLYRSSDVFCFPSLYEGFGWPPLEAMASGVPVISSNRASLPEVCGDCALYVDPYDYKGLAQAVEKIIQDSYLRNNLVEKGLKRASMLTRKTCIEKTEAVYKIALRG